MKPFLAILSLALLSGCSQSDQSTQKASGYYIEVISNDKTETFFSKCSPSSLNSGMIAIYPTNGDHIWIRADRVTIRKINSKP